MAGDWIKMRCDLPEDPAVIGIASDCALEEDTVVGKLFKVWRWANRQLRDGCARNCTKKWLDSYVRVVGFADAMEKHGWLVVEHDCLRIPKWDSHNSQSAKARALAKNRMRDARVTKMLRTQPHNSATREEKRRVYKESKPKKETRPSVDEVRAYCDERDNGLDPQAFMDFYAANGWVQGRGKPIKDWKAAVRTWERNRKPTRSRVPTDEELANYNPVDGGLGIE